MIDAFHIIVKEMGTIVYSAGPVPLIQALDMKAQAENKYLSGYTVYEKNWRLEGIFQLSNILPWLSRLRQEATPIEFKKAVTDIYQKYIKGHKTIYLLHQSKLHLCD